VWLSRATLCQTFECLAPSTLPPIDQAIGIVSDAFYAAKLNQVPNHIIQQVLDYAKSHLNAPLKEPAKEQVQAEEPATTPTTIESTPTSDEQPEEETSAIGTQALMVVGTALGAFLTALLPPTNQLVRVAEPECETAEDFLEATNTATT
jgi:hypothetical protein